ncbi:MULTISPECIES: hypothetical protein [Streptomyces]|jgi:hypothetical protein|uniref:hypothetical protein n=1 Tax=Streptomyces TaxID=1883 RepID=UPI0004C7892A|nr:MULTISPECIES: hypothetical protein [unclassified Streptomyces]SEE06434.1 hypothetical protein SAMN05216482_8987 [Streptomyces sp. PAN_FS17]SEE72073.1 hypothetical protein SAMN05428938_8307 [Streptomyces sp. KS_5]
MATSRTFRHAALVGALAAVGASVPAVASGVGVDTPAAVTTAPARSGSPTNTVDRVADFYGAYIDILFDSGRGASANSLRGHYLTDQLRSSLARWEATHHRDGVLRSKGVPIAWNVVYNDSGMGHCWTLVTLTWQDSGNRVHRTHLMVQSDLATRLISGIKAA